MHTPREGGLWVVERFGSTNGLSASPPCFACSGPTLPSRHTTCVTSAAGLAVSAHANVKAVQRMLGHAKASMTLDIYADLFDEDFDGVADRLDAAIQATADALRTSLNA